MGWAVPGGAAVGVASVDGSRALVGNDHGEVEEVRAPFRRAWVWWLRGGQQAGERAAFSAVAADGEALDLDGARNGRVSFALSALRPFGESAVIEPVSRAGDVVVAIDASTLGHFAVRVAGVCAVSGQRCCSLWRSLAAAALADACWPQRSAARRCCRAWSVGSSPTGSTGSVSSTR
jgi:hypothetical protein